MDWTQQIEAAGRRIEPHVRRTPVIPIGLSRIAAPVELKLEQLQFTGSFKARGAFNNLLVRPVPAAGVVAASGGNHGAAISLAGSRLGHRAQIFVPEMAGPAKIGLIRAMGGAVKVVSGPFDEVLAEARAYEAETGALQVHAFDAPETVAGQGTCFREWEDQGLQADTILIAVGGGGLIGGAIAWFGQRRKVVAVEPELAPTLNRALASGPDTVVHVSGVAANALGAPKIGRLGYDLAVQAGVTSVLVSEADILAAQRLLWTEIRQWVEPGGAVALAGLTSGAYRPEPGERVAVLVCGANPAPAPFSDAS